MNYSTASAALLTLALAGFLFVLVTVLMYPERMIIGKVTLLWIVLQSLASLICGTLGGYYLGVHRHTTRKAEA